MVKLKTEARTVFGKKLAAARRAGQLPAVVYGPKDKAAAVFVSLADFKRVWAEAGESVLITLETGIEGKDVLIHAVELDPVSDQPIHADFYVVDKTRKIKVAVPLEFTGVAPAVRDLGGTLVRVLYQLEVETLPHRIPRQLTVDISLLDRLESQILVANVPLPEGVTVTHSGEEVVASISVAKPETEEATATVDLSSIEVEKKGKKEEETGGEAGSQEKGSATPAAPAK